MEWTFIGCRKDKFRNSEKNHLTPKDAAVSRAIDHRVVHRVERRVLSTGDIVVVDCWSNLPRPPSSPVHVVNNRPTAVRRLLWPRPTVGGIKRCCDPSVRLSVYHVYWFFPFARRRYARDAVSNAFERGQHDRLCPHPICISGQRGHVGWPRDSLHCLYDRDRRWWTNFRSPEFGLQSEVPLFLEIAWFFLSWCSKSPEKAVCKKQIDRCSLLIHWYTGMMTDRQDRLQTANTRASMVKSVQTPHI